MERRPARGVAWRRSAATPRWSEGLLGGRSGPGGDGRRRRPVAGRSESAIKETGAGIPGRDHRLGGPVQRRGCAARPIGDQAWQDLAVRDVQDMVRRDRNHPAVVIWGVRINESENNPAFYRRTKEAAKALD